MNGRGTIVPRLGPAGLSQMRRFDLTWSADRIRQTLSEKSARHVYLNYAREHWTRADENPPVGLILCAGKGAALARYATENLPTKMLVREYLTALPKAGPLEAEIDRTRRQLEVRKGPAAP